MFRAKQSLLMKGERRKSPQTRIKEKGKKKIETVTHAATHNRM